MAEGNVALHLPRCNGFCFAIVLSKFCLVCLICASAAVQPRKYILRYYRCIAKGAQALGKTSNGKGSLDSPWAMRLDHGQIVMHQRHPRLGLTLHTQMTRV